jgi:hypothetical protein
MGLFIMNHYEWLQLHLVSFFEKIGINDNDPNGMIVSHGDKAEQYKDVWLEHNIPFEQGVAIYLASYYYPYSDTVRQTKNGFVAPVNWVIEKHKIWNNLFEVCNGN